MSPASKAAQKAVAKYENKVYDKFLVRVKKGEKAEIEEAARVAPEGSLNGYVVNAVKQRMERESAGSGPTDTKED